MGQLISSAAGQPGLSVTNAAGRHRLSVASAALTCALAPAYVIRWHVGLYPTTLLETAILLTLATFVAETIRQRSPVAWRSPFTVPAMLFILAGAISVAIAPDRRAALGLYRAYLLEPIAFFLVLSTVLRTTKRAHLIVFGLFAGGLAVAVPNLVLSLIHLHDGATNRPVVIYSTPTAIALYLVPLIALGASLLTQAEDARIRLASALFLGVSVPSSFLSFSRGGFLALAAVGLGLAIARRRRAWFVAVALAGTGLLLLSPLLATRFALLSHLVGSNEARVTLWHDTVVMLGHHPIFGVGLSGFVTAMKADVPRFSSLYAVEPIYPHNILLNFWAVTGLPGLAAFSWLMVRAFRVGWRGFRRGPLPWRPIQLGVLLALLAILVHGLVDVPYFKNDLSLEFWTLLGLTCAGGSLDYGGHAD